jgi:SAM-dependent methyltransferase
VVENSSLDISNDEINNGVLACQCCAYPVVAGIPYLQTGPTAKTVFGLLGAGKTEQALFALLGLDEQRQESFQKLRNGKEAMTYKNALSILSPDIDGQYFLYRFSDPTFLVSDAVLSVVTEQAANLTGKYLLDLCGGTGHLTRTLCSVSETDRVILADLSFWELWLAKEFIAPSCQPVCCNANQSLPFERDAFSLVFCSGAFEYIWARRALADEMIRLVGDEGTVIVSHIHNSLCENPSQGMPLDPTGYRRLFQTLSPRIFKESVFLDAVLTDSPIDLSANFSDEELSTEPSFIIVATDRKDVYRIWEPHTDKQISSRLDINPLYQAEKNLSSLVLTLKFPSDYYEMEYEDCKRYLLSTVELTNDQLANLQAGKLDDDLKRLAENYVLLDLPERYL